jgi:hypothetical protein
MKPQARRYSLLSRKATRARGGIRMERAMYFRRQAEVLLGLARATIDLGVARRLRSLAAEFQDKADEFEGDAADFSLMPSGGQGSSSDINRRWLRLTSVEPILLAVFAGSDGAGGAAMSKAEEAFSRAAMCADQAQAAQDEERRTFFKRLRDSWVRVANNYQIAESLAADDAPPRPAGMMMSGLEAAEAPPER